MKDFIIHTVDSLSLEYQVLRMDSYDYDNAFFKRIVNPVQYVRGAMHVLDVVHFIINSTLTGIVYKESSRSNRYFFLIYNQANFSDIKLLSIVPITVTKYKPYTVHSFGPLNINNILVIKEAVDEIKKNITIATIQKM